MANKTRALEILKYLQDEGYSLQDLIDIIEVIDINQGQVGKDTRASANQRTVKGNTLRKRIFDMLNELGVPNYTGRRYLMKAIASVYFDDALIGHITTELYPKLAEEYKTTVCAVEKAIRHGIEVAFDRMPLEVKEKYFKNVISSKTGKATNSEFIASLADRLHLEEEE